MNAMENEEQKRLPMSLPDRCSDGVHTVLGEVRVAVATLDGKVDTHLAGLQGEVARQGDAIERVLARMEGLESEVRKDLGPRVGSIENDIAAFRGKVTGVIAGASLASSGVTLGALQVLERAFG